MNTTQMQRGFAVSAAIGIIALLTLLGGGAYVAYEQRASVNADADVSEKRSGWFDVTSDSDVTTDVDADVRTDVDTTVDANASASGTVNVDGATTDINTDVKANLDL